MRPLKRTLKIGVMTTVALNMLEAQTIRIPSEVTCPSCEIVMEKISTLEGSGFDGPATAIQRGSSGEFYLIDTSDGLLKAYGSDGRFLRQIGNRGAGPGEYEIPRNILMKSDSTILLIDAALARISSYSSDGKFIGSSRVPISGGVGMHAVLGSKGDLVMNVRSAGAGAGQTLQRIDASGRSSFLQDSASAPQQKHLHERLLWVTANGELLVARPYAFTVDVYSPQLTKSRSIVLSGQWIPSREHRGRPEFGLFDKPYTPRLRGIWEDEEGLIWLLTNVPSQSWRPVRPPGRAVSEATLTALKDRPHVDSVIEVLDLRSNRIVARFRSEGSAGLPFGMGYFAKAIEDSDGEPSVLVSRVQLKR